MFPPVHLFCCFLQHTFSVIASSASKNSGAAASPAWPGRNTCTAAIPSSTSNCAPYASWRSTLSAPAAGRSGISPLSAAGSHRLLRSPFLCPICTEDRSGFAACGGARFVLHGHHLLHRECRHSITLSSNQLKKLRGTFEPRLAILKTNCESAGEYNIFNLS